MLKGPAKTEYMREYMRKRRAGLPTAKPQPEIKPKTVTTVRPTSKGSNVDEDDVISLQAELSWAKKRIKELENTRNRDFLRNEKFQTRLKPIIEGLAAQGRKHNATMSVVAVASLTKQLEHVLVDYGIWPGSVRRKTALD